MRHRFIEENRHRYEVKDLCQALQVSRSGFYAALRRAPSVRRQRQATLTKKIATIHEESRQTYGAPRAMSKTLDTRLAIAALEMAIRRRGAPVILHSDQGSTYSATEYRELLGRHRIRQSMSRKGDCWANAPMECFFHTLKTELVMHCTYRTRDQARASLFDYMEVFYNRQRRHSTINYEAPLAFEAMKAS